MKKLFGKNIKIWTSKPKSLFYHAAETWVHHSYINPIANGTQTCAEATGHVVQNKTNPPKNAVFGSPVIKSVWKSNGALKAPTVASVTFVNGSAALRHHILWSNNSHAFTMFH